MSLSVSLLGRLAGRGFFRARPQPPRTAVRPSKVWYNVEGNQDDEAYLERGMSEWLF
ncbi:hypothetical protein ACLBWT_16435 [Paenibacillus sp. D51F]